MSLIPDCDLFAVLLDSPLIPIVKQAPRHLETDAPDVFHDQQS